MINIDLIYWLWLNEIRGISKRNILKSIKKYGSAESTFKKLKYLKSIGKLDQIIKCNIDFNLNIAEMILNRCKELNCSIIKFTDKNYPKGLRQIYNPPLILFFKGNISILDKLNESYTICVVGARENTEYGKLVTQKLVKDLVCADIIIVSGFAVGIDAIAHKTAIKFGGKTIAVLGSGINIDYPQKNKELKYKMLGSGGLFVSEYPPDRKAMRFNFPIRNRIMAAISDGVLVTEAKEKSGSLITANICLEQGKDVFAVPHNIYSPGSKGVNKLLKDGALLVQETEDILFAVQRSPKKITQSNYNLKKEAISLNEKFDFRVKAKSKKAELNSLTEKTRKFYESLRTEPKDLEYLIEVSNISSSEALIAITELELLNLIKVLPGSKYALTT